MKKQYLQGSFTVEAAMIMGIVLLVIFAALQGSRVVYNRAKTIAYQYEYAITNRYYELTGLWGELSEEIESIETNVIEPVKYLRKAQFIKEM